jgi:hypothetical protein
MSWALTFQKFFFSYGTLCEGELRQVGKAQALYERALALVSFFWGYDLFFSKGNVQALYEHTLALVSIFLGENKCQAQALYQRAPGTSFS